MKNWKKKNDEEIIRWTIWGPQQTNDLVLLNPFFIWCPVLHFLIAAFITFGRKGKNKNGNKTEFGRRFYWEVKNKWNFFPTRIYNKAAFNMADLNCNILWKFERVYRCHFFFFLLLFSLLYFVHNLNMCAIWLCAFLWME